MLQGKEAKAASAAGEVNESLVRLVVFTGGDEYTDQLFFIPHSSAVKRQDGGSVPFREGGVEVLPGITRFWLP